MPRISSFVYGNVGGGFVIGAVSGAFLDLKAVLIFSAVLAANAAIVSMICWWRPGFDAAAWKLWLTATIANPLMLAALAFSIDQYECLIGHKTGWDCLFSSFGPQVAVACLGPPIIGVLARWLLHRKRASFP